MCDRVSAVVIFFVGNDTQWGRLELGCSRNCDSLTAALHVHHYIRKVVGGGPLVPPLSLSLSLSLSVSLSSPSYYTCFSVGP